MDRRTNDRQRPAGDAAGRRGPPQNYQRQHNNGPWGNQQMWNEEYQKMCHIIKKKKDQIKRLEEVLEARDRGFRSECKKYSEQTCELEDENYRLTLALQRQEKESQQRFDEMVARYEAQKQTASNSTTSNQSKQKLRKEVESQVRSEYQEKVAHMEKQIHQMGTDLLKLRQEQQGLLQTLAEAHTELSSKDAALQQSQEAWQAKYDALNKKAKADMEENSKSRETQENEFNIKVNLMEEQIQQRDIEILRLTEDNSCLAKELAETAQQLTSRDAELLQSQTSWQEKLVSLRDRFSEDIEDRRQSWETQQTQFRVRVNLMEAEILQRDTEILSLCTEKDSLTKKLSETTEELTVRDAKLLQSQTSWQERFQSLKDNFYRDVEEKQQSWETQQTQFRVKFEAEICQRDVEILRLTEDNASLIQKLSETTEELTGSNAALLQSQTSWQDKYTALEDITKDLAEKQQSWATEVAQLKADKVELEDLCLYINKKRKRFLFFPRRSSDDRETQLQKLKSKMLQKAARNRADEKEEEEMEAAGCSAQAGQQ